LCSAHLSAVPIGSSSTGFGNKGERVAVLVWKGS
jgi:hypothetical protein